VESLLAEMTPGEKLAQLGSAWVGANLGSGNVAPLQEAFGDPLTFEEASADGLGHLTRPLGTQPIDPVEGARRLAGLQQDIVERTRLGSSPARRAGPRSPASSAGASSRRGSCPSRSRTAQARSPAPTCIPCSAATARA
jgi:hypothetical protein